MSCKRSIRAVCLAAAVILLAGAGLGPAAPDLVRPAHAQSAGFLNQPQDNMAAQAQPAGSAGEAAAQEEATAMANIKTTAQAAQALDEQFRQGGFAGLNTADTLYYIDRDRLTEAECNMVMSLQGIVAKQKSEIFLLSDLSRVWMDALKEYYGIRFIEVRSPWDLVEKFKDRLQDSGYVRYVQQDLNKVYLADPEIPASVNTATVISGMERYLLVEDTLAHQAEEIGLVKKADGTDYMQMDIFEKYQGQLNQNVFCSLGSREAHLRDTAIALGTMVWRDDDLSDMTYMLSTMEPNGLLLGWHANEGSGVEAGAVAAYGTVFTFISDNITVYAGLPERQRAPGPFARYEVKDKKDVHYVSFIISDGDAMSIIERNFANEFDFFPNKDRGTIPFGWSITSSLSVLSPLFAEWMYKRGTVNDSFVSALGSGYIFPDVYPEEELERYCELTSARMQALGLKYTTILNNNDGSYGKEYLDRVMPAYAKQDGIQGAFLQYATNGYVSAANPGAIYWYNGKPFVNYREAVVAPNWGGSHEDDYEMDILAAQLAHRINQYKKDCTVAEGYTLINVHPWSGSYNYCARLTQLLDNDVVVVSPVEFMELISKNLKKQDVPKLDDVTSFDYTAMKTYPDRYYLDMDEIGYKKATDRLVFSLDDGMQGWESYAGIGGLDAVSFTEVAAGNYGIRMGGSRGNASLDRVRASVWNKIKLPEQDALTMTIKAFVYPKAAIRVQVLDEQNVLHTVYGWTDWVTEDGMRDYTVGLSAFAGKTVTVSIQYQDVNNTGSACIVDSIAIR